MKALLSGAAAAVSLTLLHEAARRAAPHAPRADILGMRALAAGSRLLGAEPPDRLRGWALAGDLAVNTAYYSAVALSPDKPLLCGVVAGAAAAAGLLALPGPMGLGSAPVNRTVQTQVLGAALYLGAGLIAGCTYQALQRRSA
jgi:hypothetical protein